LKTLFVLFIIAVIAVHCGCSRPKVEPIVRGTEQKEKPAVDPFHEDLLRFLDSHPRNVTWRLTRRQAVESVSLDSTSRYRQEVLAVLEKYADTSPETEKIYATFKKFNVGVAVNTSLGPSFSIDEKSHPGGKVVIGFYPEEDAPYHPASFWYDAQSRTIMVAALDWPERVFGAMLYHELHHALRHVEGTATHHLPSGSPEWYWEEVEAHIIEAKLLDRATEGGYFATFESALRAVDKSSWKTAYRCLDRATLGQLDVMLASTDVDQRVAGTLLAQHLFTAGYLLIEKTVPEKKRRNALIGYYSEIVKIRL